MKIKTILVLLAGLSMPAIAMADPIAVNSCGTLSGGSYVLEADLTASTPGKYCLKALGLSTIDLNGFSISGVGNGISADVAATVKNGFFSMMSGAVAVNITSAGGRVTDISVVKGRVLVACPAVVSHSVIPDLEESGTGCIVYGVAK